MSPIKSNQRIKTTFKFKIEIDNLEDKKTIGYLVNLWRSVDRFYFLKSIFQTIVFFGIEQINKRHSTRFFLRQERRYRHSFSNTI